MFMIFTKCSKCKKILKTVRDFKKYWICNKNENNKEIKKENAKMKKKQFLSKKLYLVGTRNFEEPQKES